VLCVHHHVWYIFDSEWLLGMIVRLTSVNWCNNRDKQWLYVCRPISQYILCSESSNLGWKNLFLFNRKLIRICFVLTISYSLLVLCDAYVYCALGYGKMSVSLSHTSSSSCVLARRFVLPDDKGSFWFHHVWASRFVVIFFTFRLFPKHCSRKFMK